MKKKYRIWCGSAVAVLSVCAGSFVLVSSVAAPSIGPKPPLGQAAPSFSLPDWNGKTVKLSEFKKKFVVLEWFSDECPFVHKHYDSGNMQALQAEAKKEGVVWLTICSSAVGRPGYHDGEGQKKIVESWKGKMHDFLIDANGDVGRLYGSKNTPTMYVVGKDGTLLYEGAIDDTPDSDPASIKTSKNYVREALNEAIAGKPVTVSVSRAYG